MQYKKLIAFVKRHPTHCVLVAVSLVGYALFVFAERHFFTYDTAVTQALWWNYLAEHGWRGIATLNADINGDYTTIWYFVISLFVALHLFPQLPLEYGIKIIAVIGSLASAVAVFYLARHFRPKSRHLPVIAACLSPFLPLFSMDLLKTNLPDSVYIAFCLWSFYAFTKGRTGPAWFLVALGACFKLMAVYLVPVYIFFYIKDFKTYDLRAKLAPVWALAAVIVGSIPNFVAGGGFLDGIVNPVIGRNNTGMTMPWFWLIPTGNNFTQAATPNQMKTMLYVILALVLFATIFFVLKYVKRQYQTRVGLAVLPALSIMVCFFLLPAQHETYFAMASLFALIGFFIVSDRLLFINFLALTVFVFYMYLYGLTWWYPSPIWILPNAQMGVVFFGLITYNYYLVYRYSVFYDDRAKVTSRV